MKNIKQNYPLNSGAAMMIVVIFFVFISLTILVGIITPTVREFKIAGTTFNSKNAYFLAESGVEDALYRIRNNRQISASETLVLGTSTTTTTITDISSSQKQIVSLGDMGLNQRKLDLIVTTGVGVSFSYGVQTGKGGFTMSNNSQIIGSVYANGPITGSGSITGSATSANTASLTSSQSNGSGVPAYNVIFGNANGTQDFGQSFQVDTTEVVNKVQLYIKKVGSPSNLTVRIVNDGTGGNPSAVTKASGTLSASLVSTNYGWVDVSFSTNPQLDAGVTYWIVIDGGTSSTKYYVIGGNSNGYTNGSSKIGQYGSTWNNNSPSTIDGFFNLFTGGINGLIDGITIGTGSVGAAYSHTVNNSTVRGVNYCQAGSGNNKACNTTLADPVEIPMPISDQNIQDWKDAGAAGGTYNGDYVASGSASLGPKKITGNLSASNGATLTLNGTIWVQGNIDISNNATVRLASGYGSSEGVIITDGTVNLGNNANFIGSGTSGSYVMVLSTSNSTSAITVGNNAGAVILYAANGTVNVSNNAGAKSITGYSINLSNNAVITYDSGLANANFSSGPSGSYNVSTWRESE